MVQFDQKGRILPNSTFEFVIEKYRNLNKFFRIEGHNNVTIMSHVRTKKSVKKCHELYEPLII